MLSEEQQAIIDSTENRITVNALAGSGKTHTIQHYLQKQKGKILYLVFNKSMETEAKGKFLFMDIDISTTYSLAFKAVGYRYKDRLGDLTINVVKRIINSDYELATEVYEIFMKYLSSDVDSLLEFNKQRYVYTSKVLATLIKNIHYKVPHQLYFKMWCISNPVLDYDVVALDEAQDSQACFIKVLQSQSPDKKIIIVGDTNQNIYQFMHTTNALEYLDWKKYNLTRTFRLKQGLCDHINQFLLDNNRDIGMVSGIGEGNQMSGFSHTPKCWKIYKRNKSIILDALQRYSEGYKVYFDENVTKIAQTISGISRFAYNGDRTHWLVKKVSSFEMLNKIAITTKDIELMNSCAVVKSEPNIYIRIEKMLIDMSTEKDCDIRYITAHRSKGLTITDKVLVMSSDFEPKKGDDLVEFLNVYYVALTRAKGEVWIEPINSDWGG